MPMVYNANPISLREGHIYIDGVEVADGIGCTITFTPDVWSGRQLGDQTQSSRWLGYAITGTINRRRSTNWLHEKIDEYKDSHITPELTIQGIMDDPGSDYYESYGSETVTCIGCVLTGDMNLVSLDSGGDVLEDEITFNARDIV